MWHQFTDDKLYKKIFPFFVGYQGLN
jgi:hypothetical protein